MSAIRKLLFMLLAVLACGVSAQTAERKVLRLLFSSAETSFDPARISDLYSRTVTTHITNIFTKLGYTSRAQIATWAGESGLIQSTLVD